MSLKVKDWEVPYIPPYGLVPECLLPDDCDSCFDPRMGCSLEPLKRFDHPQLRRVENDNRSEEEALATLSLFMKKECAGLAYEYRPDIAGLREAFRTGSFTKQHRVALQWAFSGMRRMYVFPGLIAGARLPIFEVARCFWTAFDGCDFHCAAWLNQWADNPDRPHPSQQKTPLVRFPARPALSPDCGGTIPAGADAVFSDEK